MDIFKQLAKLYIDEKKPEPVFDKPKKLPDSTLSDFYTLLKSIDDKYQKRSSEDNNHAAIESLATQLMQINQQPEVIRQKKLVDLIYSYNKKDAFALFPLLLHKSAYPELRSILEEKIISGFWEDILHGKSTEPIFLASGYHDWTKLKKQIELREHKVSDHIYKSFQEKKLDRAILPTRTPMEIIFGVWCAEQARNFEAAWSNLDNALAILENFKDGFSLDSFEQWLIANTHFARALGTEYNFKVSNQRILFHEVIKTYQCSLQSPHSLSLHISEFKENIIKEKDALIRVTKELRTTYFKCYHEALKLGQYWDDMYCVHMIFCYEVRAKASYNLIDYIKHLTNFIIAVATPAKDKHWLLGHHIYVQALAVLVKSISEYSVSKDIICIDETVNENKLNTPKKRNSIIYNCCLNAIKHIYIVKILIKNCDAIIHNAYLGNESAIKAFKPKKELRVLYRFLISEAERTAPTNQRLTADIANQHKVAKNFASSVQLPFKP